MSIEDSIFQALQGLVSGRVFRVVARTPPARPYITFQQVGGLPINFVESAHAGKYRGRFQFNVWADDLDAAAALARQIEQTLVTSTTLRGVVETGLVTTYEADTELFGTRQDFSFIFAS